MSTKHLAESTTKHVEEWVTNIDSFLFILEAINHQYEKKYIFFYFMIISVWSWLQNPLQLLQTTFIISIQKTLQWLKMIKSKNQKVYVDTDSDTWTFSLKQTVISHSTK